MKRLSILVLLAFVIASCETENPFAPTSAEEYLNEMIDVMEAHHINRDNIDWTAFRAAVLQKAIGATGIVEADESILLALQLLDDKNSFVLTARNTTIEFKVSCEDVVPPAVTTSDEIGYVKIPAVSTFGVNAAVFAEKMHGEISDQDKADLKGWIVDLRGNTGGNLWPMIAGIGPILGDGTLGFFVNASGTKTPFGFNGGSSTFNDESIVTVSFPYTLVSTSSKVAVLMDHSTSNAGEGVVVAFSGKPNTRSFGAPTCGVGGGSQPFQLSDGSVLFLFISFLIDRNEKKFQGIIQPDEVVSDHAMIYDKAVEWINQ